MSQQSQQPQRPVAISEYHQALLQPAICQILRASGFHSTSRTAMDTLTDMAARYMYKISKDTAFWASHNNPCGPWPSITDVRLALEDNGALSPVQDWAEFTNTGIEDTTGVDDFIEWVKGKQNARIRKVAGLEKQAAGDVGEEGVEGERDTSYLDALKRKHNKTDQDSKYAGTILGRGLIDTEVTMLLGADDGEDMSIEAWARKLHEQALRKQEPEQQDKVGDNAESRPPSSGLSSLDDEDVPMMGMDF
ncbi:hypothetical protein GGR54DRAFT_152254 [Hypoxylon sp. NC1633]|nr:hypothetical protein GGR54DRAFT_152254 [Hypoxylon sp. NC1633]